MVRLNFFGFLILAAFVSGCSDDKFSKLASPVFIQNGSTTTTTLPGSPVTTLGNPLTTTTTIPNLPTTTIRIGSPTTTSTLSRITTTVTYYLPSTTTTVPLTTTTSTLPRNPGESSLKFNRICRQHDRPYYEKLLDPELRIHLVEGITNPDLLESGTYEKSVMVAGDNQTVVTGDQLLFTKALPSPYIPAEYMVYLPKAVRDAFDANPSKFIVVRICSASVPKEAGNDSPECLSGQQMVYTPAHFLDGHVLPIHHAQQKTGLNYCDNQLGSPLILDLDDNGIELVGADPGVQFDLLGSGQKINTGWTTPHRDAFLALDLNHNGIIDNGNELFGNNTFLRDGKKAANGFEALKQYDQNRDGVINPRDRAYHSLILWVDANQDGISQREEMKSMAQENVETIDLDYIHISERDAHGNETRQRSAFKKFGDVKRIRRIVDIWFVMN